MVFVVVKATTLTKVNGKISAHNTEHGFVKHNNSSDWPYTELLLPLNCSKKFGCFC